MKKNDTKNESNEQLMLEIIAANTMCTREAVGKSPYMGSSTHSLN